jgi:hypothetical protein
VNGWFHIEIFFLYEKKRGKMPRFKLLIENWTAKLGIFIEEKQADLLLPNVAFR